MNTVREYARRHNDQERAGNREESGEVNTHHAAHHAPRPDNSDCDTDQRTEHGDCVSLLTGGADSRPDKESGLQAFTAHGERCQQNHSPDAGLHSVQFALELVGEHAGVFSHPENHPGDEANRNDGQGTADGFLRFEGEGLGAEGQQGAEAEGQQHRHTDASPHRGQQVGALRFADVGEQDTYDQSRFEALA